MTPTAPQIPLEALTWTETGDDHDPRNRLLATFQIGPQCMHLEAMQVTIKDGIAEAHYSGRKDDLGTLEDMEQCAFETLEMDGRQYVLYATPFGC